MSAELAGFLTNIHTSFGKTTSLDIFTQTAGLGSLLFISFYDFKQAVLGPRASAGYYAGVEIA